MPYCSEARAPTRCGVVNRDFVFETTESSGEIDCPQGSPEGGGGGSHQKEQLRMFMLTRQLPLELLRESSGRRQQGQREEGAGRPGAGLHAPRGSGVCERGVRGGASAVPKRKDGARKLRGGGAPAAGVLWSVRDLRVGV
jgi:hypothetical protein